MSALDPDRRVPQPLADILGHLRDRPQRTWSIVITVFGDVVAPRGGSIWLGSLLDVFAGMQIPPGAVRTAMSRLTADGWLARARTGRHSFYSLTEIGRKNFAPAEERIYGAPPGAWDGRLHLLVQDGEAAPPAGAGIVSPGLLIASPQAGPPSSHDSWLRIDGRADLPTARRLARRAWPLGPAEAAYKRFVQAFAPLRDAGLHGLDALAARILLIHDFRRIALRDPRLPPELLPDPWVGTAARALCSSLYASLLPASEAWLDEHGRDGSGPLPAPSFDLARRFAR